MIFISIKDLLPIIPELIDLFLSGLLFLTIYGWLNAKKYDISILTLWSLFISYIIKSFYNLIELNLKQSHTSAVYVITGVLLAFLLTWLKQTKLIKKILPFFNHKSINDDIFDDVIDYDQSTMMSIFLKNSDIYYIGRFAYREEKGNDSWICLADYVVINKQTNETTYDPAKDNLKSSIVIPLSNIERIELVYENDSKVWKRINGE